MDRARCERDRHHPDHGHGGVEIAGKSRRPVVIGEVAEDQRRIRGRRDDRQCAARKPPRGEPGADDADEPEEHERHLRRPDLARGHGRAGTSPTARKSVARRISATRMRMIPARFSAAISALLRSCCVALSRGTPRSRASTDVRISGSKDDRLGRNWRGFNTLLPFHRHPRACPEDLRQDKAPFSSCDPRICASLPPRMTSNYLSAALKAGSASGVRGPICLWRIVPSGPMTKVSGTP